MTSKSYNITFFFTCYVCFILFPFEFDFEFSCLFLLCLLCCCFVRLICCIFCEFLAKKISELLQFSEPFMSHILCKKLYRPNTKPYRPKCDSTTVIALTYYYIGTTCLLIFLYFLFKDLFPICCVLSYLCRSSFD